MNSESRPKRGVALLYSSITVTCFLVKIGHCIFDVLYFGIKIVAVCITIPTVHALQDEYLKYLTLALTSLYLVILSGHELCHKLVKPFVKCRVPYERWKSAGMGGGGIEVILFSNH